MKLSWPPRRPTDEDPVEVAAAVRAYIDQLQAKVLQLEAALLASERREVAARRQADALAVRVVVQDTAPEDLVRARRVLAVYEGMLAACRDQHGGNTCNPHVEAGALR